MKAGDLCRLVSPGHTGVRIISWWVHESSNSWCVRESFEYCKDDVYMYICNHDLVRHGRSDPDSIRTLVFNTTSRQFHYVTDWLVKQL